MTIKDLWQLATMKCGGSFRKPVLKPCSCFLPRSQTGLEFSLFRRVAGGAVAKEVLRLYSGIEVLAYVQRVQNVAL